MIQFLVHRWRSMGFACKGIGVLLRTQPNAWVHAAATLAVVALGVYVHITRLEWALLALAIGAVWTAEALNTGIEFVVDLASPDHHVLAGKAKDVAAAGVLLASVAAVVVGLLVFAPYFFKTQ
nr:diacylglycerol kinase family protein [uncultured Limnohabitans sp.]